MNNEPNKPIPEQELTEKELESITGGGKEMEISLKNTVCHLEVALTTSWETSWGLSPSV